ncbi:MAG: hypothetical protein ACPL68_03650 [Candidatus Hydrothermia bacterium]
MRKTSLAVGVVLFLVSCQERAEEKPRLTTVFAYFYSHQDTQSVFVDTLYGLDEPVEDTCGLSGATVMLQIGQGPSIRFPEDTARPGRYISRLTIIPETDYTIRVESPIGDTCELTSRSPKAFNLLYPREGDTMSIESLYVVWTDPGNPGYVLRLYTEDTTRDTPYTYEVIFPLFPNGDTSQSYIPAFFIDTVNYWYDLTIAGYDTLSSGSDRYHDFAVFWAERVRVFVRE